jgi:hypothetical protein
MNDIISRHYEPGGTVIRAMAAKLVAGGKIAPHVGSDDRITFIFDYVPLERVAGIKNSTTGTASQIRSSTKLNLRPGTGRS